MRLYIGTSGYAYPPWKGRFYPQALPNKKMLSFYSEKFSTVEINNTFYRLPEPEQWTKWPTEVGSDFRFAVKATQTITHHRRVVDVGEPLTELLRGYEKLGQKRGPLLFQLPPNFKKDLSRLTAFLRLLPRTTRAAFEFRHESWFDEEVYGALRKRQVALCIAEDDKLATPPLATAGWGYLRLRREDYRLADLRAWSKRIAQQDWDCAYIYFKHEDTAKGPRLAAQLQSLM